MKRSLCILLLLAAGLGGGLRAQDLLEVKRVELDSLVRFLRREFRPDIYFVKDPAEQSTFSVSAPRGQFLEAAFDALREKGYIVSSYGTSRFILHSKSVFTSLPTGLHGTHIIGFESDTTLSVGSDIYYLADLDANTVNGLELVHWNEHWHRTADGWHYNDSDNKVVLDFNINQKLDPVETGENTLLGSPMLALLIPIRCRYLRRLPSMKRLLHSKSKTSSSTPSRRASAVSTSSINIRPADLHAMMHSRSSAGAVLQAVSFRAPTL